MMPNNIPFTMAESIQRIISDTAVHHDEEKNAILLTSTPVEIPGEEVAEKLFNKSIADMTPSDREHAYEDIHAIPVKQEEDPAMIEQSLERLDYEIEIREDNQAYHLAKSSNPAYVLNRNFRLLFLRSDRFDATKAAFRMVRHFQIKMELFGKEKLGRDIVQDDLDEDDLKVLYNGNIQLLPTKDRGGRAIFFLGGISGMPASTESRPMRMRRLFYLIMLAAKDTDSCVTMTCLVDKNISEEERAACITGASRITLLFLGMPMYLAAIHLGYDSEVWAPVESVLKVAATDDYRVRVRTFQGSIKEWLMSLQSYGIHPDQVPLRDDGSIERSDYQQLLQNQRVKERLLDPALTRRHIKSPGAFDVVFGKGSRYQDHEGNVRLRRMISDCRKAYDKMKRGEKSVLIREIVDTVKQSSGLFLKEDGGEGWIVVDDEAATTKVGAVFRTMRSQEKE